MNRLAPIQNEMLQLGVYALVVRGQGQDLLMGRSVNHFIKVPGLESLLHNFITDLDQDFEYIYKNDVDGFLRRVQAKTKINLIDLSANIKQNLAEMQDNSISDDVMIYYLVITKTLESLRETIYNREIWSKLRVAYKKLKKKEISEAELKHFRDVDAEGTNSDFSLLYSLLFIAELAKIYQVSDVQQNTEHLIQEKFEHLLQGR